MIWDEIQHFTREEFVCPCCGRADMELQFLKRLDFLRETLGHPIIVTSGYRCPDYNDEVSSTGRDGPHTTGKAADLALSYTQAREALSLVSDTFEGIGLNQKGEGRFIHVDSLSSRLWTY